MRLLLRQNIHVCLNKINKPLHEIKKMIEYDKFDILELPVLASIYLCTPIIVFKLYYY